jgi:hypothetical protein
MVCLILGLKDKSSLWDGMYMFNNSHGLSDKFCMLRIWKYDDILAKIGILLILFGKKYALWMRVRIPPRIGVYSRYLLQIYVVGTCVLLKISLY